MYQTKLTTYDQTKVKNTIVGFGGYDHVFKINSEVKKPHNLNAYVKKYRKC